MDAVSQSQVERKRGFPGGSLTLAGMNEKRQPNPVPTRVRNL
jgi:hypothetical protein